MGSVGGIVVYVMALFCVPVSFGRHRHPLHAAHCRAAGFRRGSRDEMRALDMMCAMMTLPRWAAAASFAFQDVRVLALIAVLEASIALLWAAQRLRMVLHRRARKLRRQTA